MRVLIVDDIEFSDELSSRPAQRGMRTLPSTRRLRRGADDYVFKPVPAEGVDGAD